MKRYGGSVSTHNLPAVILDGARCAICYRDIRDESKTRVLGSDGLQRYVCADCAAKLRERDPAPAPEEPEAARQLPLPVEVSND